MKRQFLFTWVCLLFGTCGLTLFESTQSCAAPKSRVDPEIRKAVRFLGSRKKELRQEAIEDLIKLAEDGKPVIESLSTARWTNAVAHAAATEVVRQLQPELAEAFDVLTRPLFPGKIDETLEELLEAGTDPTPITPLLISALENATNDTVTLIDGSQAQVVTSRTWKVADAASSLLARCAPKDDRAFKALMAVSELRPRGKLSQSFFEARNAATFALGTVGASNPKLRPSVLPVLQRALGETEAGTIFMDPRCVKAMETLAKYGDDAKPLVPLIRQLARHSNRRVSRAAAETLTALEN